MHELSRSAAYRTARYGKRTFTGRTASNNLIPIVIWFVIARIVIPKAAIKYYPDVLNLKIHSFAFLRHDSQSMGL